MGEMVFLPGEGFSISTAFVSGSGSQELNKELKQLSGKAKTSVSAQNVSVSLLYRFEHEMSASLSLGQHNISVADALAKSEYEKSDMFLGIGF